MGTRHVHKLVEKETFSRSSTILRKRQLILKLRIQGPHHLSGFMMPKRNGSLIDKLKIEIRNVSRMPNSPMDLQTSTCRRHLKHWRSFSNKRKNYFYIKTHTCVTNLTSVMISISRVATSRTSRLALAPSVSEMSSILRSSLFQEPHI